MSIYDYIIKNAKGENISMSNYKGKVLLIVNTATKCGFTPQYKDLVNLYDKYNDRGFEIIDIPCNQFAAQTPENDEEISKFCSLNYGTKFEQMQKSDVNGENELALYTFLKSQKGFEGFGDSEKGKMMDEFLKKIDPNYKNNDGIKWNFTKFIVSRMGDVVARFEPTASMHDVDKCVVRYL